MKADFDQAAESYDAKFTLSLIGALQRNAVYEQLNTLLQKYSPNKILEINCGTGEDALWLEKKGFEVVATDISEKMIALAQEKAYGKNLSFKKADIRTINGSFMENSFDLFFSNFGGLNCLSPSELGLFLDHAFSILTPNGQLVMVIMPRNTIWEQFYFLSKMKFNSIFRRKKVFAIANVEGEKIKTYYYNPKEIVNLANTKFVQKYLKPIGLFIPPSYLEPFLKNKPKVLALLNRLEHRIKNISWLSKYADHYFIVLQKK